MVCKQADGTVGCGRHSKCYCGKCFHNTQSYSAATVESFRLADELIILIMMSHTVTPTGGNLFQTG